ncbi:uncharacterized [Tachysurus ichikawai]
MIRRLPGLRAMRTVCQHVGMSFGGSLLLDAANFRVPFAKSLTNCFHLLGSFDVQHPPSLQRRLAVGAEEEADGPRQDETNLTSLFLFQVLQFNKPSLHKLLWSTFEIRTDTQ